MRTIKIFLSIILIFLLVKIAVAMIGKCHRRRKFLKKGATGRTRVRRMVVKSPICLTDFPEGIALGAHFGPGLYEIERITDPDPGDPKKHWLFIAGTNWGASESSLRSDDRVEIYYDEQPDDKGSLFTVETFDRL